MKFIQFELKLKEQKEFFEIPKKAFGVRVLFVSIKFRHLHDLARLKWSIIVFIMNNYLKQAEKPKYT